jgi:hypothetical protein
MDENQQAKQHQPKNAKVSSLKKERENAEQTLMTDRA